MWMWAVVPSEPLCLHTQSLATAKNMQEYASAQRMIILFLRGLHEGRSENTNQVKSEKRLPEQIGNWLGHTKSAERMKQGAPECIQRTTYVKCHVTFCACAVIVKTP
eukprot:TRINITY_DN50_c0_g1_i23.p2 TRINITY_DN50_c0_g1~~TRINITY_DN50_c0_g1_i23.p2  ORF type:complete len:107 (+),score=3.27 TRINITY_DN50_c0_g1_i23:67-387(+)